MFPVFVSSSQSNLLPFFSLSQTLGPPTPASPLVASWLAAIAYPLAHHVVLPLYFKQISIQGQDHVPTCGPVILAPTHRSRWDAILVAHATGRPVSGRDPYFMVSANEMRGLQGWLIRHLGGFPVNTDHPGRASLRCGLQLLQAQGMVVVFPEGGIYQDGQMHPLKLGAAHMALQVAKGSGLNVKVVPIAIHYSQSVPCRGCSVAVNIGKPLQTTDYAIAPLKLSTQHLTADLTTALTQLESSRN